MRNSIVSLINEKTTGILGASPLSKSQPPKLSDQPSAPSQNKGTNNNSSSHKVQPNINHQVLKTEDLLPGETLKFRTQHTCFRKKNQDQADWVSGTLFISNYRFFFSTDSFTFSAPIMSVESVTKTVIKETVQLSLKLKDFRMVKFAFEQSQYKESISQYLSLGQSGLDSHTKLFAFSYQPKVPFDAQLRPFSSQLLDGWKIFDIVSEYQRMNVLGDNSPWKLTSINSEYRFCESYPSYLVVPKGLSGPDLVIISKFRAENRIPVFCWKRANRATTITRTSQPLTGFSGQRCEQDEKMVELIKQTSPSGKLYIIDLRPKVNAMANQYLRGGGFENTDWYQNCILERFGIPNIHGLNDSWNKMHKLVNSKFDNSRWLSSLESTGWLQTVQGLLAAASRTLEILEQDSSVMIHCTDGWDRTSTIVSLTELLLDPYYRTFSGFIVMIEKDWISFGHNFAERCGHSELDKRLMSFSPVFMIFMDCVWQIMNQYPFAFEFKASFLIEILNACYSCQYGTFLANEKGKRDLKIPERTPSLWTYVLSNRKPYLNNLYYAQGVLHPSCVIKDLQFWSEYYCRGLQIQNLWSSAISRSHFTDCVVALIQTKDDRIAELEKELMKYSPQIARKSVQQIVAGLLDDIIQGAMRISNQRTNARRLVDEFEEEPLLLTASESAAYLVVRDDNLIAPSPPTSRPPSTMLTVASSPSQKSAEKLITVPNSLSGKNSPKIVCSRSGTFKLEQPPAWRPDSDVKRCFRCQADFTPLRRKHHCRNCGEIFCAPCSNAWRKIEKYGFVTPVRVCLSCDSQF